MKETFNLTYLGLFPLGKSSSGKGMGIKMELKQKSIQKNMFMSMILTTANFLFPLLTYSYVARVLTPVGTGKVAFIQAILTYFTYVSVGGIPAYGRRECAKIRDDKQKLSHLAQELILINLVLVAIAYIMLIVAVIFVPRFNVYKELFAIMGSSILLSSIGIDWLYQALEEYSYITYRSLLFKCIAVVLTFVLIRTKDDYLWYGFLTIFTAGASNIMNFLHARKHISLHKVEAYHFKKHFFPILTFFSVNIMITIYSNFDVTMIGFIGQENDIGLYSSALKIKNILLSLSTAVTAVIVPRMAYCFEKKELQKARKLMVDSLRVSLLMAVPLALYVFIFAESVLTFLCGGEYLNASNTLRVLMLCIIPLILTNLFGNQLLIPLGKEKRFTQSVFVGMFANIILNLAMIPFFGAFGAALSTLIVEWWNVYWMSSGVKAYRKEIYKKIEGIKYLIPLAVSVFMGYLSRFITESAPVFWRLAITAAIFFLTYYAGLLLVKEKMITSIIDKVLRRMKK